MINPPRKIKIEEIPGKGRGVIAVKKIKTSEIIEDAPIILFTKE